MTISDEETGMSKGRTLMNSSDASSIILRYRHKFGYLLCPMFLYHIFLSLGRIETGAEKLLE